MNDVNTRTTSSRDGAGHPSARKLAAARRAKDEPTLAEANEGVRAILAAQRLMDAWGVETNIEAAAALARARVRGAQRRSGT
ncbi:hypothetical protein LCGC14_1188900 [marine sediment metagenome]|uniref:Uncharacterized protein n=1 Tax=marine sediment metagenome TaxID=412755 RepID=A0A0F9M7R2_9ZZZZ